MLSRRWSHGLVQSCRLNQPVRVTRDRFQICPQPAFAGMMIKNLVAGIALMLVLFAPLPFLAAPSAFALGLEKVGLIVPTGLDAGLLNPTGFWYDNLRGSFVVANTHARQLAVLNSQGQALRVLGKKGEFGFPVAVAGNRDGTLYIARRQTEDLLVLPAYDAATLEEYHPFDLTVYRRTAPVQPAALFIDNAGSLYMADRGNRQILVFDRNGNFLRAIAGVGEPADLWVGPTGKLVVADPGFGGFRIYGPDGIWLRTIGGYTAQLREPLRPKAVAVDRRERIWGLEETGGRIKVLDALGNLLLSVESGLTAPADLAVDDQGHLYVLDQGGKGIAVFRITGF